MIAWTARPEQRRIDRAQSVEVATEPACCVGVQERLRHADDGVRDHGRVRGRLVATRHLDLDHLADQLNHLGLHDAVGGCENPLRRLTLVLEESPKRTVFGECSQLTLEHVNEPFGAGAGSLLLRALDPPEQRDHEFHHRRSDHLVPGSVPAVNGGARQPEVEADGLDVDPLSRQETLLDRVEHLFLGGRRWTARPSLGGVARHVNNRIDR